MGRRGSETGQQAKRLLPLFVLALVCALPEGALLLTPDPAFLRGQLLQNFAFWPGILGGGWAPNYPLQGAVMFLTYGFLHAGISHFLFNMMTLVSLGAPLLSALGTGRFLLLYAAGLVGGGLGYALLSTSPQPMVGASGALFALAGALVVQAFARDWRAGSHAAALRAAIWPIVLLVGLNVVMYVAMNGQLAWEAHLGGALAGMGALPVLLGRSGAGQGDR